MSDDLAIIARDLKLPFESIKTAVRLLDEGNAIPFVARFRKDLTGGLDADQLSSIKQRVGELRALAERKSFVLKSIESQGKLTEELSNEISRSTNSRRLEDLYLPFKPKKQSLAMTARQQGLEPLANEIFAGERPDIDLPSRATEFVRVDKGTNSVDEVIAGVRYLIA
ncbi:MAG: Tex-like N-terminal domain-containing protein, partial [Pirellulaceae bacterium]